MDEAARENSIQNDMDVGIIYVAISNLDKIKAAPHLLKVLREEYGMKNDEAIKTLSERVEHFKQLIFKDVDMTEDYFSTLIAENTKL